MRSGFLGPDAGKVSEAREKAPDDVCLARREIVQTDGLGNAVIQPLVPREDHLGVDQRPAAGVEKVEFGRVVYVFVVGALNRRHGRGLSRSNHPCQREYARCNKRRSGQMSSNAMLDHGFPQSFDLGPATPFQSRQICSRGKNEN